MGEPCDSAGLVNLLAGDPALDVPFDRPRFESSTGCGVDFEDNQQGTVRGAFATGAVGDDHWRRCVDMGGIRFVRCDEDHLGEYVATASPGRATQDECLDAVSAYLRHPVASHASQLRVRVVSAVTAGDPARCLVAVVGTQPLTASLRWLDTRSVPLRR